MSYFTYTPDCEHYPGEWEDLLIYIRQVWPKQDSGQLRELAHHIEAKALYVFTMSRHLIDTAERLPNHGGRESVPPEAWKPVFVEASMLLFPMLELVGEARLGREPSTGSWRRLASGIDWLVDPSAFPTRSTRTRAEISADDGRIGTLGNYMTTLSTGPRVRELYHLRNYFIHGLKNQGDLDFDIGAVQTSMNYELPYAIVQQAKVGLAMYWMELKDAEGSGSRDWTTRLAAAKIYPFGIMESSRYAKGLVDPDIVCWLSSLRTAP